MKYKLVDKSYLIQNVMTDVPVDVVVICQILCTYISHR